MAAYSVQVTYEHGRPLAGYIYLQGEPGQRASRTEHVSPDVLIDYSDQNVPLGIEVLAPGRVSLAEIHEAFDRIGLERPSARDLQPLQAA